ncbi:ABC transporter [Nocardiopsis synnemataformans]|uniref:ABC transporter n=1 Tax=Nocardiopsis synnemataformans TaxID=61305 RepID=UPI003EBF6BC6
MNAPVEPPVIRRRDVIAAETTKIITNPVAVVMVAVTVAVNTLLAAIDASGVTFYTGGGQEPSTLSSFGTLMIAPVYAFLVLPVYAAASEYREGQIRVSLTATPDRRTLLLGKLAAMTVAVLAAAVIVLVPARLIIGFSEGLEAGELLLDLGQWIAVYAFMSFIAFGLAGLLRSTITSLGILVTLPIVVATGVLQWPEGLRLLPDQAGLSLVGTPAYDVHELSPGVAALTLTVWTLVSLAVYALSLMRRDA